MTTFDNETIFDANLRFHPLHGGGNLIGKNIVDRAKTHNKKFKRALDMCCGAGFIGAGLLKEDLVEELHCTDINPKAVELCTANMLNCGYEANCYVSNVFENVRVKFDLITVNPPWWSTYCRQMTKYKDIQSQLIWLDKDWAWHRKFLRNLHLYLNEGGVCILQENETSSDLLSFAGMTQLKVKDYDCPAVDSPVTGDKIYPWILEVTHD